MSIFCAEGERIVKKFLRLTLAFLLMFSFMSVFSSVEAKDDHVLTVGFDQNFPPFGYVSKGKFVGFDIDLAREAAKRMGYKLKLQPIDWDSKDMELDSGTIDCIWNGFTMTGRENKYTWSKPYLNNRQVVIVKKDAKIKTLKDLKGKIVACQKESSAESALESKKYITLTNSFKQLLKVADYNTGLMDLSSGGIDAIAMDEFVAKFQIKDKTDTYRILNQSLSSEKYAIGFKKGNTALRDKVQKQMDAMIKDGTFNKLSKKWFGENVASQSDASTSKNATSLIVSDLKQLGAGMLTTLQIFFLTLLFSLPLGLLIALGRMSKHGVIKNIMRIYISIMRGTPLMLQLLVVYFGPYYMFGINVSSAYRGIAVVIAFVLNYAAYFAEIYRSGIASMERGQYEAAQVLGYSPVQTFFIIILPQVWKRILPSITNEVITLVKDTSLAFSIAYAEMFTQAKALAANERSMMPFVAAAIFYYVFNFIVAAFMEYLEKRMSYYE